MVWEETEDVKGREGDQLEAPTIIRDIIFPTEVHMVKVWFIQ